MVMPIHNLYFLLLTILCSETRWRITLEVGVTCFRGYYYSYDKSGVPFY